MRIILTVLFLSVVITCAYAAESIKSLEPPPDPKQVALFRKDHACPSTGKFDGACPDFVVDHVWSRCLGGPDIPANMRWQSRIESFLKDVFERDECDMKRKLEGK